jgi:pimeloyl-ACP methyl ester carboxylesterase
MITTLVVIATAIVVIAVNLVGLLVIDAQFRPALQAPSLEFVQGTQPKPRLFIVFDGFLGHPQKRFAALMDVFEGGDVLFVNPQGDRFNLNLVARTVKDYLKAHDGELLSDETPTQVVLVGGSLGAKVAYKTALLIEQAQLSRFTLVKLVFIDPLYDGSGLKLPIGGWLRRFHWSPGAMQNWLFAKLKATSRVLITNDPADDTAHSAYGRGVMASRIADEAREAAGPAVALKLSKPLAVTIVYCNPADDEVLKSPSQVEAWMRLFPKARIIMLDKGTTHHMGLDTEPEAWRESLRKA